MKRIVLGLLTVCMVIGMAACAGKTPGAESSGNENETTNGGGITAADEKQPAGDLFEIVTKISGKDIYFNYKIGRDREASRSSLVFYDSRKDLVVLAYDEEEFTGGLSGVLPLLNDGRIPRDFRSKTNLDFYDAADVAHIIDIKTTKNTRVNGIDTQQFTGSVRSTDNIDCFVYGYAFIFDDTPCVLAGVVTTREQEQTRIDSVIEEVDTMMKTVRSER